MSTNSITAVKSQTIDAVATKIRAFQTNGELNLPANYSPENALKSAWLTLQAVKDKNDRPALEVCTRDSIANALLSMVVQGLNPDKKQAYFIVYGSTLALQRSHFGSMTVAKRVDPAVKEIFADVVYEGDTFNYAKHRGRTVIQEHTQQLENVDKSKITAAYCTVIYCDDTENTTIMTIDQIKQAWRQSQTKPVNQDGSLNSGSVHAKFTEEMAKKTVTNRACKAIINASDDGNLVVRMARTCETDTAGLSADDEIECNANSQLLDVDVNFSVGNESNLQIDPDTGEVQETPMPATAPY